MATVGNLRYISVKVIDFLTILPVPSHLRKLSMNSHRYFVADP